MAGSLTLLAAGAGAGKSAALADWAARGVAPGPVAWLGLDSDDGDRRRFWSDVVDALRHAGVEEPLASLRVPHREGLDGFVAELLSAIDDHPTPIVLVLEDLHEVESGTIHADLGRTLRRPSANLRLVVSTRVDPPFALGRLRVNGDLAELRSDDLAFTPDETRDLFELFEQPLDEADCRLIWERTQGWAAGLRLASSAMLGHADRGAFLADFAGDDGAVADYLVGEVLMREEPEMREFMMRASMVERLIPELVAAVTGRDDSARLLEDLHHRHAFVTPADAHRESYNMHPLVREFLRARLRYNAPDALPALHRRAAVWLIETDEPLAALRHAVAGGHVDLAARIASQHWIAAAAKGELGVLGRVLERMHPERLAADAGLSLALAAALAERGEAQRARQFLVIPPADDEHAQAMRLGVQLLLTRASADADTARAAGEALEIYARRLRTVDDERMLHAFVHTNVGITAHWAGKPAAAQAELQRGLAAARQADRPWLEFCCLAYLAIAGIMTGRYNTIVRRADAALECGTRFGWARTAPAGAAFLARGVAHYDTGDLDAAEEDYARAEVALRSTHEPPLRASLGLHMGLAAQDRGDNERALDHLTAGLDELEHWHGLPPLAGALGAQSALLRAALGDPLEARRALTRQHTEQPDFGEAALALAKLSLGAGAPGDAREWLAPMLRGERFLVLPLRIDAWALEAIACDQIADHSQAARALESALELAEPSGMRRPMLTHGAALRPVLRRHARNGTAHRTLVDALLHDLDEPAETRAAPVLLAEALSDREVAVLRYLPTMMSNQEIAGELFVSVNTVKTHLRAIYRKLDAGGRREAVKRARELSLLGP